MCAELYIFNEFWAWHHDEYVAVYIMLIKVELAAHKIAGTTKGRMRSV